MATILKKYMVGASSKVALESSGGTNHEIGAWTEAFFSFLSSGLGASKAASLVDRSRGRFVEKSLNCQK